MNHPISISRNHMGRALVNSICTCLLGSPSTSMPFDSIFPARNPFSFCTLFVSWCSETCDCWWWFGYENELLERMRKLLKEDSYLTRRFLIFFSFSLSSSVFIRLYSIFPSKQPGPAFRSPIKPLSSEIIDISADGNWGVGHSKRSVRT